MEPSAIPGATATARNDTTAMNRNTFMLIIAALVIAIGVLGYMLYQAKKEPTGVQINVGKDGIRIEQK